MVKRRVIRKGTKVKLKSNFLDIHAKTVPKSRSGRYYTKEQLAWRNSLNKNKGRTGKVTRTFKNSDHVNVQFGKTTYGVNKSLLRRKNVGKK